jgi:hypothetical protein
MALELIESEIRRFLSTAVPEVICIRGRWGVGKTFAWNKYVREARTQQKIALKRYSYVSLFGITSLDDFKFSIFENIVRSDKETEPSLETLRASTIDVAAGLGRKAVWFAQQLPWVKNHIGGLGPVWFLSVRNAIVCVDDFERRGERLAVRDVLGLVSTLKEHKGCKVALILNDEALENDRAEFEKYLEKVIDASLKFAPSPAECVGIALPAGTETGVLIKESCLTLGISNIRVIKKIERAAAQVEPILRPYDNMVLRQAVQSLALLGWSIFEPKLAPPLDYLEKREGPDLLGIKEKRQIPESEGAWNALIDAYHWQGMDEFDRVLRDGLQNGFFDPALLEKHGSELHTKVTAAKAHASWEGAWRIFHESFAHNEEQVLDAVHESFLSTVEYRTPLDLNSTVWLLKKLGRSVEAHQTIASYFAARGSELRHFDLDTFPFRDRIDDPDVIQAFRDKCGAQEDERSPVDTLLRMASTHGWNDEDMALLSALPVDEYYKMLRTSKDQDLLKILDACLQFDRIANATEAMRAISKRAREALRRIGQESPLNALRVKKYGLDVDDSQ